MVVETPEGEAVMEEDTIVVMPAVAEDAPSEPHMGEPASESQPQPVYPGGEPAMDDPATDDDDSTGSIAPSGDDGLSSQPQPVYPDGAPEGL
jgi:hypothetical protein